MVCQSSNLNRLTQLKMADKTIPALSAVASVNLTDILPVSQSGGDAKKAIIGDYLTLGLSLISSTATGLTYTNSTGVLSLTSGYTIPTTASLATYLTQGGNTFGVALTTGTADNFNYIVKTNNTTRLTISNAGVMTLANLAGGGTVMVVVDNAGVFSTQAIPSFSGITTLNTLTGATQTFAVGTSGTNFAIVSSGTTHTFNIPDASASARGLVTTGAQGFAGQKSFSTGINSTFIQIDGTNGSGYINLIAQASAPSTPASGVAIYADSSHRFAYKSIAGFVTRWDSLALSADRTYTLPDVSMTIAGGTGANTRIAYWNSANELTSDVGFTFSGGTLTLSTTGGTLSIKGGTNGKSGETTLVAGTKVIANSSITADSKVLLTITALGTVAAPKPMYVTLNAGVGFTITSSDGTDTSDISYVIFEVN